MIPKEFLLETYNYQLDPHYIAQKPVSPAESAKLLVCTQGSTQPEISTYAQLPQLLDPKSVLYYNNSKVIPARLRFSLESYGKAKEKEGEIFFLGHIPGNQKQFEAFVSPGKLFPIGSIHQQAGCVCKVLSQTRKGRILECLEGDILTALAQFGTLPLPPYIKNNPELYTRYQTVFAQKEGSLAAPTASLHFSETLLDTLQRAGIKKEFLTLHVGLGTFETIQTEDIRDFSIHEETFEISSQIFESIAQQKIQKHPIVAVGTTSLRVLESLPDLYKILGSNLKLSTEAKAFWENIACNRNYIITASKENSYITARTQIFISPGYTFLIIDELITNFHLPKSSLIMLVSALYGIDSTKAAYEFAKKHAFRFFSFGDGMYIKKSH